MHGSETADRYYESAIQLNGAASLEKVFELYARSAELGNPIAQYNIAMMYSNGESVYVDYQQAAYWFTKSAQQDFPAAQYRLGEMYYFGIGGLPRDQAKAVALFQAAAQQGDPDAQLNLAMIEGSGADGKFTSEQQRAHWDKQKEFWIERAAKLGVREAQEALERP